MDSKAPAPPISTRSASVTAIPVAVTAAVSRLCTYPLSIHVNDLSLTYVTPSAVPCAPLRGFEPSRKRVLQRINAHVRPGQLLALMGGSGCGTETLVTPSIAFTIDVFLGKTTLLNVMSARQYGGDITGSIVYTHRSDTTAAPVSAGMAGHTHDRVITDQAVIKALSGYGTGSPVHMYSFTSVV